MFYKIPLLFVLLFIAFQAKGWVGLLALSFFLLLGVFAKFWLFRGKGETFASYLRYHAGN